MGKKEPQTAKEKAIARLHKLHLKHDAIHAMEESAELACVSGGLGFSNASVPDNSWQERLFGLGKEIDRSRSKLKDRGKKVFRGR